MNYFHQYKRAVIVGIFVLLGTAFLIAGILLVGNLHDIFTRKIEIVSVFDDVGGLQEGNNVWFSGVKVGTVSELSFCDGSQVKAKIQIETKARNFIHRDAKVKLSSDGFIGNKILIIVGGAQNSRLIEEGDTLQTEKTLSSDDIINTLEANNQNILAITDNLKIITQKLVAGEGTIGKLLTDESMYSNFNTISVSLKQTVDKANAIAYKLDNIASELNKKGTLFNELTSDTVVFASLKKSIIQLEQMTDSAKMLIANIKQASNSTSNSVGLLLNDKETANSLKTTLKNLESSSQKLDQDLEAAQHNVLLRGYFKKKAKSK